MHFLTWNTLELDITGRCDEQAIYKVPDPFLEMASLEACIQPCESCKGVEQKWAAKGDHMFILCGARGGTESDAEPEEFRQNWWQRYLSHSKTWNTNSPNRFVNHVHSTMQWWSDPLLHQRERECVAVFFSFLSLFLPFCLSLCLSFFHVRRRVMVVPYLSSDAC